VKWTVSFIAALSALLLVLPLGALRPPQTSDRVALGRKLFFEPRLSDDGSLSCSNCHIPDRAFSDGRAKPLGVHGLVGDRNSPALINVGSNASFFWDGRESDLERQTLAPIFNPKELGLNLGELERRTGMPAAEVGASLASYVRTIRSSGSPVDRYLAGDTTALNATERDGLQLFRGRAQCVECHAGPDFTDDRFHNTGVAFKDGRIADDGRFTVSRKNEDRGAFKTPTLREVARTAPYMHDGSIATLEEVVEFYVQGGRRNSGLDPRMRPLTLNADDKRALIAFLKALSGTVTEGF
jgi:cytochrome c peroxidase